MNIMKDKSSGVSRGFGFIEMTSPLESQAAIADSRIRSWMGVRWTLLSRALLLEAIGVADSVVEARNVGVSKEVFVIDYSAEKGNMCTRLA